MRQVSENELNRMKKRGGTKVKRKLGTGPKKSEPEVPVEEALSGVTETKSSAPAPSAVVETDMKPYASMAASMAASTEQTNILVENNTKAIKDFSKKLDSIKPAEKSKWQKADFIRHKVERRKDKLIDYVDSIPMRMTK